MSVVTLTDAWPKPGEPFTVSDLDRMPDDGHRYELLDGTLVVSPAPGCRTSVWRSCCAMSLSSLAPKSSLSSPTSACVLARAVLLSLTPWLHPRPTPAGHAWPGHPYW